MVRRKKHVKGLLTVIYKIVFKSFGKKGIERTL